MAAIGLKLMAWAKMKTEPADAIPTYDPGKVLGKMISLNVTVNNSEGELYADDMLAEYASEFSSGDLTADTDNIELEDQATLMGATYTEDGEYQAGGQDTAPYGGVGGFQVLLVKGARRFRCWFYPKVKAAQPDIDATTKGDSVSFGTQQIKMKITKPEYGPWYYAKEFATEEEAKQYIFEKLGVVEA